jgi:hypothetical protein
MNKLLLCEFHDAAFEELSIDAGAGFRFRFSHIACYYSTDDPKTAELWLSPATMILAKPIRVELDRLRDHMSIVSEATFEAESPASLDRHNLSLLSGLPLKSMRLIFDNGAQIVAQGGIVLLQLESKGEFLELFDWQVRDAARKGG